MAQFENFRASALYCAHCQQAQPVRESARLGQAGGQVFDYFCVICGSRVGTRQLIDPTADAVDAAQSCVPAAECHVRIL